jgi:hypothetical protein
MISIASSVEPNFVRSFQPRHPRLRRIAAFVLLCVAASGKTGLAADFSDTNLRGARLTNADLRGSDLRGANLAGADLSGSDFRETNITQPQLDNACGSGTILPAGLRVRPCIPRAVSVGSGVPTNLDQASLDSQQPPDSEKVSSNPYINLSIEAE